MVIDWEHWVGEVIDSTYPLHRFIEGNETTGVFLTGFRGERQLQKAVLKVICLAPALRRATLARWESTTALSHPNILDLYAAGESRLDGMEFAYMVTEFPEESLAEVIPDRALSASEAKEFLAPTLDALSYLHEKGFAHSAIGPANLFAVQDTLKISRDAIRPMGDSVEAPGPFPPPELASQGATSAGDIWGLGLTLIEVLTQSRPERTAGAPVIPAGLPEPFPEVVRNCLDADPSRRWNATRISKALTRSSGSWRDRARWSTARIVRTAAVLAAGIVVAGVALRPVLMPDEPGTTGKGIKTVEPAPPADPAPAKTAKSKAPERKAEPEPIRQEAEPRKPAPDPKETARSREPGNEVQAPAKKSTALLAAPSDVASEVLPDVQPQARRTIRGKVAVSIRVRANAAGDVVNAGIDDRGPSWFFADLALDASKKWKFAPATGGSDAPREWVIQYQFLRNGTKVFPRRVVATQ